MGEGTCLASCTEEITAAQLLDLSTTFASLGGRLLWAVASTPLVTPISAQDWGQRGAGHGTGAVHVV